MTLSRVAMGANVVAAMLARAAALEATAPGAAANHPAIKEARMIRDKAALHEEGVRRMSEGA